MTPKLYIPRDSAAVAVGAEDVSDAFVRALALHGVTATIVRTGSRGLYWLEPLVEVEMFEGRVAYGPVTIDDVHGLLAAGILQGRPHPLRLGLTDQIPFLKRQNRLVFARCGIIDPLSVQEYCAFGGFEGLTMSLSKLREEIVQQVSDSGIARARGCRISNWSEMANCPKRSRGTQIYRL